MVEADDLEMDGRHKHQEDEGQNEGAFWGRSATPPPLRQQQDVPQGSRRRRYVAVQAMQAVHRQQLQHQQEGENAPKNSKTGPVRRATASKATPVESDVSNAADEKANGRVRISSIAVNAFEYVYAMERKPTEAMIRVLSQAFGETFARVKVWFQNRRGRDRLGSGEDMKAGSEAAEGKAKGGAGRLPPQVLQSLLAQQRAQNPSKPPSALEKALAEATSTKATTTEDVDISTTTAQALNAMLTVSSISRFWAHHNHLLATEIVTREGERITLDALAEDERVSKSPVAAALLERVVAIRQGVIDQFVMTDSLIRDVLPFEQAATASANPSTSRSNTPFLSNGTPDDILFQPHPSTFGAGSPGVSEMSWETFGYHPFTFGFDLTPAATPVQQQHWEFVQEDHGPMHSRSCQQQLLASHQRQTLPRRSPIEPQQQQQLPVDMYLAADDPAAEARLLASPLPIKPWILEGLLKALRVSAGAAWKQVGPDELLEASTTGLFEPSHFHKLCAFLSLHDEHFNSFTPLDANGSTGPVQVRVTPTLEGHAGWVLRGPDFIRVLPEPLRELFVEVRAPGMPLDRLVDLAQVYLMYDLKKHILTVRALYTIP